jgi:putative methionine-R-sulfoxide reductase with GAF domain
MNESELGRIYSDGEIIFREGDAADALYVIQSGKINVTKKATSGELVIATLQSGEIFGEMALFDRLPRSATARASGNATILTIDKKKLFSTISRDPTLVFKLLESMSQRTRKLDEELMQLKKSNIDISHFFIDVDEACNLIMAEAKNIVSADNGSIMLFDDEVKSLAIKAAFGTEWDPKMRFAVGEGIAGDVLSTGKAELINNVSIDSRFKSGAAHIKSMLCVPLKWKSNNFGVINMSKDSEKFFTLDHLKLLHSIAIYASVAIGNAQNVSKFKNVMDEILRNATLLDMW